jgi:hypothetical protein
LPFRTVRASVLPSDKLYNIQTIFLDAISMSTLIAIPAAGPHATSIPAPSNRRLAWGLLVSLLLHALLLSLQFGVPGLRPGAGRPLSVVLAPSPVAPPVAPPVAVPPTPVPRVDMPAPVVPAVPDIAAPPPAPVTPAPGQPAPAPRRGFTLRDPAPALPAPPAPKPTPPARRTLRRRSRPRLQPPRTTLHTEVIARQASEDPSFVLPQPELPALTDVQAPAVEQPDTTPAPQVAQQVDEDAEALARADAERELAQQRAAEQEAKRAAERQLAEQRRAEELARQQVAEQARLAEQQRTQQLAEQRRADEMARQQLIEQQRVQQLAQQMADQRRAEEQARQQLAEQQRAQQIAEQRRADEAARQQLAEQQRAQQLAEQRRAEETARQQLAEQQRAQQLAEQRRAEEAARQQLAEQKLAQQQLAQQQLAEQQRARQLADQHQAEERAQQEAARQRAEELARKQAAQADAAQRLARQDGASRQPAAEQGGGLGGLSGNGGDGGARGLPGKDFGSRARELLRGIDVAKAVPPAMRAAEQAQQAVRRAFANAARHDVPLRMYIDSVRQKIERNATVSEAQLSSQAVHTDPVVSIAIRSDGSIEDVTILRSSGRPDIDEIVRRVVRLNARYAAFPANVAANYDVIELRRIWTFAGVLRLVEEVR